MMQSKEITAVIQSFPATFGLRAFPGKLFKIAVDYCYHNGESIQIVTEVESTGGKWLHFSRSDADELRRNIIPAPHK